MTIRWKCPKCGAENEDDPDHTSFPMCWVCGEEFDWYDVSDPKQLAGR